MLREKTAWADDFRVAACTLQLVANTIRSLPDDDDQGKNKKAALEKLKQPEKTFVEAAAEFIKKSQEANGQGPWRQWAREATTDKILAI